MKDDLFVIRKGNWIAQLATWKNVVNLRDNGLSGRLDGLVGVKATITARYWALLNGQDHEPGWRDVSLTCI
jgi:hypothetical protein